MSVSRLSNAAKLSVTGLVLTAAGMLLQIAAGSQLYPDARRADRPARCGDHRGVRAGVAGRPMSVSSSRSCWESGRSSRLS